MHFPNHGTLFNIQLPHHLRPTLDLLAPTQQTHYLNLISPFSRLFTPSRNISQMPTSKSLTYNLPACHTFLNPSYTSPSS